MEKVLLFIKHHFGFLWKMIEWGNGVVFYHLYHSRMEKALENAFSDLDSLPFTYRRLTSSDSQGLFDLIETQNSSDLEYFKPHGFSIRSILKQFKNQAFVMMGSFEGSKLVGYFFLRFFSNKKCFVGRIVDKDYRGKGVGWCMNKIMYRTAWEMDFQCLSTISRKNHAVMKAHEKNLAMVVRKELKNDYLLVEFVKEV